MNEPLNNAILQKVGFKGPEMRRYQAAVILRALELHPVEVAADDVPPEVRPENPTTAGCVFAVLKGDGQHIFLRTGRRASKSKKRNSAWINTYRLTSVPLAESWLRANGFTPPVQPKDVREGQKLLAV